jgi:RNA polymerase sporulation-specific sigma factor
LLGGDSEDLIQEGLVGLYKAIRDFRSDRESSFRNFAELCITRQIITAVKTATRNKHTPLNGYVSFSAAPAGAGDSEPTLDEVLPGSTVHDPVNQVISSEELRSLVACL